MKIEISSEKINPFSGINFVIETIRDKGIDTLIDREFGERGKGSVYRYSDM